MIISIVIFIIGVALFFFGVQEYNKVQEARGWNKALGKIVGSRLREYQKLHRDGYSKTMFAAIVEYEFLVGGKKYKNDILRIGQGMKSPYKRVCQKVLDRFPLNQSTVVYYNPRNPKEAVLDLSLSGDTLFKLILGAALMIGSGIFLVMDYVPIR